MTVKLTINLNDPRNVQIRRFMPELINGKKYEILHVEFVVQNYDEVPQCAYLDKQKVFLQGGCFIDKNEDNRYPSKEEWAAQNKKGG